MEKVVLSAKLRSVTGKQVKALRRQGELPAVIYGHGIQPLSIKLDLHTTSLALAAVSSSQLVDVEVEGTIHTTLVRERQRHPVRGDFIHLDFQEVSMTEKLHVMVNIFLRGDAPAVKEFNGVVVQRMEEIEIEALPGDLPDHIEINLEPLTEIGSALHVHDLVVPSGVEVLSDADEVVVVITAPIAEIEPEEAPALAEPEVIERGKKEEEDF